MPKAKLEKIEEVVEEVLEPITDVYNESPPPWIYDHKPIQDLKRVRGG